MTFFEVSNLSISFGGLKALDDIAASMEGAEFKVRVANRTGLAPGKTPLAVEKKLLKVVTEAYLKDAHHWLILLGRYTCVARKPRCGACVIEDLCEYKHKVVD